MNTPRHSIVDRMIGAATLNIATYEEVEADESATAQAAGVVVIVAICSAIGSWGHGGRGIIGALIGALVGWAIWSAVTYFIGSKLFHGTATWGELLRTLGFAQAAGVLLILGIIPLLGGVIRFIVMIWILVAGVIAVRQALDFSTGKALATAFLGWLVVLCLSMIFFWL